MTSADLHVPSESPLHHAAQCGDHNKVQHLLYSHQRQPWQNYRSRHTTGNAELPLLDSHGYTALHYAVRRRFPDVVKCLLDIPGARLTEVRDNTGKSAMHWAAHLGYLNMVELLCKAKASVTAEDRLGWRPLHYLCASKAACKPGRAADEVIKIMKLMFAQKSIRGESLQIWLLTDTQGRTPLHLAARNGATREVLQELLKLEGLREMEDAEGWNAIHWAVFGGLIEPVETLIGDPRIAQFRVVNEQSNGPPDIIKLLMSEDYGEGKHLKDKEGRIPKYFAEWQGFNSREHKGRPTDASGSRDQGNKLTPFLEDKCLTRLERIIKRKQLQPLFTPEELSSYQRAFSALPCNLPISSQTSPYREELIVDLGAFILYDHAVIIDDSTSMGYALSGSRRESALSVLHNIRTMKEFLCPERKALKLVSFSNDPGRNLAIQQPEEFDKSVNSHKFGGNSRLGTAIWQAVVKPLRKDWELEQQKSKKLDIENLEIENLEMEKLEIEKLEIEKLEIKKPMVVMILTDGQIDPIELDILETAMLCATRTMQRMSASGAILFQFVNFGTPIGEGSGGSSNGYKVGQQKALEVFRDHPELRRVVDVLDWETNAWDIGELQQPAQQSGGGSSNTQQSTAEKMGRMLLAPMMESYKWGISDEE